MKGVDWTPPASVPLEVRRIFSCLPCGDLSGPAIFPVYFIVYCFVYKYQRVPCGCEIIPFYLVYKHQCVVVVDSVFLA